jgi:flagellar hook-length control protein FliK
MTNGIDQLTGKEATKSVAKPKQDKKPAGLLGAFAGMLQASVQPQQVAVQKQNDGMIRFKLPVQKNAAKHAQHTEKQIAVPKGLVKGEKEHKTEHAKSEFTVPVKTGVAVKHNARQQTKTAAVKLPEMMTPVSDKEAKEIASSDFIQSVKEQLTGTNEKPVTGEPVSVKNSTAVKFAEVKENNTVTAKNTQPEKNDISEGEKMVRPQVVADARQPLNANRVENNSAPKAPAQVGNAIQANEQESNTESGNSGSSNGQQPDKQTNTNTAAVKTEQGSVASQQKTEAVSFAATIRARAANHGVEKEQPLSPVRQMVEMITTVRRSESGSTVFRLRTEQAGDVEIRFKSNESRENIRVIVENEQVREYVQRLLPQIMGQLQASGLDVAEVKVEVSDAETENAKEQKPDQKEQKQNEDGTESRQMRQEKTSAPRQFGYNTMEIIA